MLREPIGPSDAPYRKSPIGIFPPGHPQNPAIMGRTGLLVAMWLISLGSLLAQAGDRLLLLDGQASYRHQLNDGSSSLNVSPTAQIFLGPRWAVGAIKSVGLDFRYDFTTYLLLPSARYYFSRPSAKLQAFGDLALGPVAVISDGSTSWAGALLAGVGLNLFLNPAVAGELTLAYTTGFGLVDFAENAQLGLAFRFRGFLYRGGETEEGFISPLRRGTWMVGGSTASLGLLEAGSFEPGLRLRPDGLFFLGARWAIGGALPITYRQNFLQLGFFPALRLYLGGLEERSAWFLGLSGGYAHSRDLGGSEFSLRSHEWRISPEAGFHYFFNPTFALEARAGYTFLHRSIEHTNISGVNTFRGNSPGLFVELGFQVFLRRKD